MTLTANENLSGYFQVQVGTGVDSTAAYDWGSDPSGNSTKVGMRQAYVDWVIPQTVVKVRMGRQLVGLPEDAFGKNAIMHPGWQGRDGIVVTAPADRLARPHRLLAAWRLRQRQHLRHRPVQQVRLLRCYGRLQVRRLLLHSLCDVRLP